MATPRVENLVDWSEQLLDDTIWLKDHILTDYNRDLPQHLQAENKANLEKHLIRLRDRCQQLLQVVIEGYGQHWKLLGSGHVLLQQETLTSPGEAIINSRLEAHHQGAQRLTEEAWRARQQAQVAIPTLDELRIMLGTVSAAELGRQLKGFEKAALFLFMCKKVLRQAAAQLSTLSLQYELGPFELQLADDE